jgi:hypothetical protein
MPREKNSGRPRRNSGRRDDGKGVSAQPHHQLDAVHALLALYDAALPVVYGYSCAVAAIGAPRRI